ncbi:hypothetical protein B0H11DRAFT_2187410 [Mycena galericulata]|nr:hypothetical protein B0H11DRAFT_2187410 [Mycena galericulata]
MSSPLPDPHENVEPLDYKEQFQGREPSKFIDPCQGASKASLKWYGAPSSENVSFSYIFYSMDQNNYDRNACMDYFQAYRDCKAAWVCCSPPSAFSSDKSQIERRKDDRRNGRPSD